MNHHTLTASHTNPLFSIIGQSYEIKLRKISGLELQGNILKSVIRVGFQERRLQYMEKDLLQQWKQQRSSERILEVDIPLSYGVFEIIHPDEEINKVEFAWDPSNVNINKDSGIFIKVNRLLIRSKKMKFIDLHRSLLMVWLVCI